MEPGSSRVLSASEKASWLPALMLSGLASRGSCIWYPICISVY